MKNHIVCFGDSNTHGYCADPNDTADHTDRFTEDERWTCLLQKALGEDYLVLEEGLSGRTTVFRDPLHECMSGLDVIYSTLMSHEPVDLLIIMLGTNDTKERFNASPACIGIASRQRNRLDGFCELWGSKSQCDRAEPIRRRTLSQVDVLARHARIEDRDAFAELRRQVLRMNDAAWWIEHKNDAATTLAQDIEL